MLPEGKPLKTKRNLTKSVFSDRLVTLVQVVFAVVIGGGLIEFGELLFFPKNTIACYALIGVFLTSVMSWTGYHARMGHYPYTPTKLGVFRLYVDIFIVAIYAFLLFAGTRQGQSIELYLWGFSGVFLLYVVSGWLRCMEHNDWEASELRTLIGYFLGFSLFVPSLFTILICWTDVSTILLNQIFVWLPLVVMLIFRLHHDWIKLPWRI